MRIYLAGPMTGYERFNFPAFDAAAAMLRKAGHEVCNPAEHDRETYGDAIEYATPSQAGQLGFSLRAALAWDLDWIAYNAEAVVVLPGWEKSEGARAEIALARALSIPIERVSADVTGTLSMSDEFIDAQLAVRESDEAIKQHDVSEFIKVIDHYSGELAKLTNTPIWGGDVVVGMTERALRSQREYSMPQAWVDTTAVDDASRGKSVEMNVVTGETRTTSATGGKKGTKPQRFDLLPRYPLEVLAEHYGRGATKYADHNWRQSYEWSKAYAALQRHAWAFWSGEDIDPENGSPHLAAVAFHAFSLLQWSVDHPEFDDRYKPDVEPLPEWERALLDD